MMKVECYLHEGWAPRIRPASAQREWMDETPERFAYRCLPLALANAHGWEIGSPCGFSARWNGGTGVDAVEIVVDPGTPDHRRPVSLFGQGTLTHHVEGLIRTSPGWNLWVSGPPNRAKDGIAPLTGVIETDWSPYTFTMKWWFTRPGHWVRWDEDEPFCFFFESGGTEIIPDLTLGYRYDGIARGTATPLIAADGTSFAGEAYSIGRNTGFVGASVTAHGGPATGVLRYRLTKAGSYTGNQVEAVLRVAF